MCEISILGNISTVAVVALGKFILFNSVVGHCDLVFIKQLVITCMYLDSKIQNIEFEIRIYEFGNTYHGVG